MSRQRVNVINVTSDRLKKKRATNGYRGSMKAPKGYRLRAKRWLFPTGKATSLTILFSLERTMLISWFGRAMTDGWIKRAITCF